MTHTTTTKAAELKETEAIFRKLFEATIKLEVLGEDLGLLSDEGEAYRAFGYAIDAFRTMLNGIEWDSQKRINRKYDA